MLSIRNRIEGFGGRLEVRSSPGSGTTAVLVVPLRAEARHTGVRNATDTAAEAPGRIRVLLVDDHPAAREGVRSLLDGQPDILVVAEASDGHAAVELARALLPDVVLMDVSMPRQSGIEAARLIVSDSRHVKVIGLSVSDDERTVTAMRNAGASAFVTKGGDAEALFRKIRVVVRPVTSNSG